MSAHVSPDNEIGEIVGSWLGLPQPQRVRLQMRSQLMTHTYIIHKRKILCHISHDLVVQEEVQTRRWVLLG